MSHKYLCGTPQKECAGALTLANNGLNKAIKAHTSREEAFRCHVKHLLAHGYTRVEGDSRAFRHPNGGVYILSKKSKFGAELRPGKSGGDVKAKRFRPQRGAGTLI